MTQSLAGELEYTQELFVRSTARKDQLDHGPLSVAELLDIRNTELFDLFEWYLSQPWAVQQRFAHHCAEALNEARALRNKNGERAQRMLAKRGF